MPHRSHFSLRALFICVVWAACRIPQAESQSMLVSEPLSIRNDYGYEIIGRLRDRILLFRDKFDEFEIQAYDNQMNTAWNKELDDLDRRGVQVIGVVPGKNDFSIIFKLRRKGTNYLRIHKYDPSAKMIDSMTVKNFGERIFSPLRLDMVRSDDNNCIVVYNTGERSVLEAVCFRLDRMQVLWDRSVIYKEDDEDTPQKSLTLSNDGDFFVVTEQNNRKSKLENHAFHINLVNAGDGGEFIVKAPDFLVCDAKFTYDNRNKQLVGAGLFGEKNKERANGSFYIRLNPFGKNAPYIIRHEPFDDQFISILRRKDVEDDSKGISDADVKQLFLRYDGGVVMIVERHYEIMRGAAAGRGFLRDGSRMVMDFYYDDLFAIATQPDGRTHWKTALHKKQYSQDDDAVFSSFFALRYADRIRFMFNDEIRYENTCSEYVLSAAGAFDRNSLLSTFNQNLRLRYRDALQISGAECIVPSEYRNKLKLVLLKF